MPAAVATSSTLTSENPRSRHSPIATSEMCAGVVDRRRPTRGCCCAIIPFRSGTRCHILTEILTTSTRLVEPHPTKGNVMEPQQQTDSDTELVTETLVEE